MRISPKIENEFQNIYLTRWDQYDSLDPTSVCLTCKHFEPEKDKCMNESFVQVKEEKKAFPSNIWESTTTKTKIYRQLYYNQIDCYGCGEHEWNKELKPFIKENPYKSDSNMMKRSQINDQIRKQLSQELDIDIHFKIRSNQTTISINNLQLDKCKILKTKIYLSGYVIEENEPFSKFVDNKLAGRKITTIELNPKSIQHIYIYQNGDMETLDLLEFIPFLLNKDFSELFDKNLDKIRNLKNELFQKLPNTLEITKDFKDNVGYHTFEFNGKIYNYDYMESYRPSLNDNERKYPIFYYEPLKILFHPDHYKNDVVLEHIFGKKISLYGTVYSIKRVVKYWLDQLEFIKGDKIE